MSVRYGSSRKRSILMRTEIQGSTMQGDLWLHTISTDNLTGATEGVALSKADRVVQNLLEN